MSKNSEKKNRVMGGMRGRRFRYGWFALLLTALFIALVVIINVIAGAAEDKWALKIDASPNSITSFTDQTYDVLSKLGQPVHIYLLYQKSTSGDRRITIEEMVNKYRALSDYITVETIDPVTEPGRVNKYKDANATLSEGSLIVTNEDESRVKLISSGELYSYTMNQYTGSYSVAAFNGESKLTTALMYVTSEDTPKVYFLSGHGEIAMNYCNYLTQQLTNQNYDVSELTLGGETKLAAGDTVVLVQPTSDLTDGEYEEMLSFLKSGGRMLFAADPSGDFSAMPNFVKLLDYYGLGFADGVVIEDESSTANYMTSPLYLVPNMDADSEVTKPLANGRLILPNGRAVVQSDMPLSGVTYEKLLTTSDRSYRKASTSETSVMTREEGDEEGPFALAMSALLQPDYEDPGKDTRIVLIGNLYTVGDSNFLLSSNNLDFSLNCMDWLVNRDVSVYIRSKAVANESLSIPNAGTLWFLSAMVVIVIPAIVLIAGIAVWLKRRRL